MIGLIFGLVLTTFISVDGNVVAVAQNSPEAIAYTENAITDIGNPDNLESAQTINEVSGGDAEMQSASQSEPQVMSYDNSEEISLLTDAVELLAENSTSVTGTMNSTVLNLMDRIIQDYPSYYKYAGLRIDADDSYRSVLYIAKRATVNGDTITFSDDCIAVNFYRYQQTGYSSYVYYDITESPGATVNVSGDTIVYTNCIKGCPSLGTVEQSNEDIFYVIIFAAVICIILIRKKKHA